MSQTPSELKYASSHEWARLEEDGSVTVGITDRITRSPVDTLKSPATPIVSVVSLTLV